MRSVDFGWGGLARHNSCRVDIPGISTFPEPGTNAPAALAARFPGDLCLCSIDQRDGRNYSRDDLPLRMALSSRRRQVWLLAETADCDGRFASLRTVRYRVCCRGIT